MILNTPKIDSLRLIVPFDEVTVNENHSTFLRQLTTINEDGEVLNTTKNSTYRLNSNPCSCHYLKALTIINGNTYEVLKIGFSSKTLKHNYFDGINASNIDEIYNFIISEKVIHLSKETLLKARVVDVDVCIDIMLKDATVKETVKMANTLSILHKGTSPNHFTKNTNTGIEWSNRNKVGKSYLKKQYLKYYAKSIELKYNSIKFYEAYIKGTPADKYLIDDKLIRIETTIKNNAHWNTYGRNVRTLRDLLALDLSKNLEVFKRPINHYMTGSKFVEVRTNLTPSDKEKLELIRMYILHYNFTENEAIESLSVMMEPKDKSNRSRYKKKLINLCSSNRVKEIKKSNINQLDMIDELEKLNLIPK